MLHAMLRSAVTRTTSAAVGTRDHLFTFPCFFVFHLITEAEVAVFTGADSLTGRCRRRRRHGQRDCRGTLTDHCRSKQKKQNTVTKSNVKPWTTARVCVCLYVQ